LNEKDPVIKEKAIEKIKTDLNGKQGAGRGHKKKLTTGDVKDLVLSDVALKLYWLLFV